ncbi:MAG TPA: DUF86 domain-containing protein [Rhabdochlamydiaceae bacterium]|nr:DUF86 domain-containing protein [Rhabdochlamydiaceae bacterium]
MSSREWSFRIQDILSAIDKIQQYIKGMTLNQFKKNSLVIDAVVRNIEIIGEASKAIPAAVRRSYPDVPWERMCGMRDIVSHRYFGVDIQIVWRTARKSLPSVRRELKKPILKPKRQH